MHDSNARRLRSPAGGFCRGQSAEKARLRRKTPGCAACGAGHVTFRRLRKQNQVQINRVPAWAAEEDGGEEVGAGPRRPTPPAAPECLAAAGARGGRARAPPRH